MDDKTLALLGDRDAAKRLTEAGVLLPCICGKIPTITVTKHVPGFYADLECECGILLTELEESEPDVIRSVIKKWNTRVPILTPTQLALLQISAEPRVFEEEKSDG